MGSVGQQVFRKQYRVFFDMLNEAANSAIPVAKEIQRNPMGVESTIMNRVSMWVE